MPVYLRWLRGRLDELGGHADPDEPRRRCPTEPTTSWSTAPGSARAGWPATSTVRPVRGQVVLVDGRRARPLVAGLRPVRRTSSRAATPSWSAAPTRTATGAARRRPRRPPRSCARATELVPELAGARVVAHRVGLRPVRPAVRLEAEGRVVHCYGQGGAGVTVSWGCADEVTRLVAELADSGPGDVPAGRSVLDQQDPPVQGAVVDQLEVGRGDVREGSSRPSRPASSGKVISRTRSARPASISCRPTERLPRVRRGTSLSDLSRRDLLDEVPVADPRVRPVRALQRPGEDHLVQLGHAAPRLVAGLVGQARQHL